MHETTLGSDRQAKRTRNRAAAFGLALACTCAHAAITVKIVPNLQLVAPGSSARFRAKVEGTARENDVIWEVLEQDQIKLEKDGWRGIRFEVPAAGPWTRIAVRATSAVEPSAFAVAHVEILPQEPFKLITRVLGENWVREATSSLDIEAPGPMVVTPSRMSFTPTCTISARTGGIPSDRLRWKIIPDLGTLTPVQESKRSGCQAVKFVASWLRFDDHDMTVTLEHLDHPDYLQQVQIRVPKAWLADWFG